MKVLFCVDGSEAALAALRRAARFIRGAGARACVLYVVPEVDDRFRHYERLHEHELRDVERLFGDQTPGVEVLAGAREALRQEGVEAAGSFVQVTRPRKSWRRSGRGDMMWLWWPPAASRGWNGSCWEAFHSGCARPLRLRCSS